MMKVGIMCTPLEGLKGSKEVREDPRVFPQSPSSPFCAMKFITFASLLGAFIVGAQAANVGRRQSGGCNCAGE